MRIDFENDAEPEEFRPMPDGRYEGAVRHKAEPPSDPSPKPLRKEGRTWYWGWEEGMQVLDNERILWVRRIGDLQ